MTRLISCLGILLLTAPMLLAQCEECPEEIGFTNDYCYTSELIEGHCAQFSLDADHFYYHAKAGKAGVRIPMPEKMGLEYLLSISNDKALKIKKPQDILFIQQAVQNWQQKSLELIVNKVGENKFTAEELEAMQFEVKDSGLGVHVIEKGSGSLPQKGKNVKVHYRGYLATGEVFDASFDRGTPFEFPLGVGRVIKGWDEGIGLLPIGSHLVLRIPPEMGYGGRAVGSIPANSTLFFDVLILDSK